MCVIIYMHNEIDPKIKECIEDCSKCHQICELTLAHCAKMGGDHAEAKHLAILKDCIDACKISEAFMLRGSSHSKCMCSECAEICDECAESCEKIDPNDAKMKECAEACRKCAESCREMSA